MTFSVSLKKTLTCLLMFDLTSLFEFSRAHCVAICAFLVPANLVATIFTLSLVGLGKSPSRVWISATIANLFALSIITHVLTWFLIGVVMPPTYILLVLGSLCFGINMWAIVYPLKMKHLLRDLLRLCHSLLRKKWVSQPEK